MTKDKKDAGTEAGQVFSFDENAGDVAEDTRRTEEPFEIPAFLRRSHPATQREPEVETPWKDDDFARIAATAEPPKQPSPDEITPAPQEEPKPEVRTEAVEATPAGVMCKEEAKREEIGSPPLETKTDEKVEKEISAPVDVKPADRIDTPAPVPEMKRTPVSASEPMSEEVAPPPVVETTAATSDVSEPLESSRTTEPKISSLFAKNAKKKPAEAVEPAPAKVEQTVDPKPQPKRRAKATPADNIAIAKAEPSFHVEPAPVELTAMKTEPGLRADPALRATPTAESHFFARDKKQAKNALGERVEPSFRTSPVGEASRPSREAWRDETWRREHQEEDWNGDWCRGPLIEGQNLEDEDDDEPLGTVWIREEKSGSLVRRGLLVLAVALGGYAVADQIDTRPGNGQLPSGPEMAAVAPVASPSPLAQPATAPTVKPAPVKAASGKPNPVVKPALPTAEIVPPMRTARVETPSEPRDAPAPVVLAPGPRPLTIPAVETNGQATASGELILDVQQRLVKLGYSTVPLNGRLDAATRQALMSFQRDAGLPMTGATDTRTLGHLRRVSQVDLRLVKGPQAITPP